MTPPKVTVLVTEPFVAVLAKAHDGRSPPGAEITMRSAVPARKVWAIGFTGTRTITGLPAGRARRSCFRYVSCGHSGVELGSKVRFDVFKNPEVTYSSWFVVGRTSVTETCSSVALAVDESFRSRLAGPTMVMSLVRTWLW